MGKQTAIVKRRKYPEITYVLLGMNYDLSATKIDNLSKKEVNLLLCNIEEIKITMRQIKVPLHQS